MWHYIDALARDGQRRYQLYDVFSILFVGTSAAARLEALSSILISFLFASALSYKYAEEMLASTSYHQPHNASYLCSHLLVRRVLLCICVDGTQAGRPKFVL